MSNANDLSFRLHRSWPLQSDISDGVVRRHSQCVDQITRNQHTCPAQPYGNGKRIIITVRIGWNTNIPA